MSVPVVQIQRVDKVFGSLQVLSDVTFDVHDGEVACLIGPSGAGKSTLLRCINRLEHQSSGMIFVGGEPMGYRLQEGRFHELDRVSIARQRQSIGMVFQRFNLFAHRTALENVIEAPVALGRMRRAEAVDLAKELLDRVGLAAKANEYPAQLSGGQQQRVAIVRALAMKPRLLLFDEPTSALDPELVGEVLAVMRCLAEDGMTMILVTHEIGFARKVADTVHFMASGQVVESGPAAQVLSSPQQPRTRAFLSRVI